MYVRSLNVERGGSRPAIMTFISMNSMLENPGGLTAPVKGMLLFPCPICQAAVTLL